MGHITMILFLAGLLCGFIGCFLLISAATFACSEWLDTPETKRQQSPYEKALRWVGTRIGGG